MKNSIKYFASFSLGLAIGCIATAFTFKNKYEKKINDELDLLRKSNTSNDKIENNDNNKPNDISKYSKQETKIDMPEKETNSLNQYMNTVENLNYSKMTTTNNKKVSGEPYIISDEEFGDHISYDNQTLTYYCDNVLADDNDIKIENIDELIGYDSLEHFGEYEEDAVFVRNDREKCDYEIYKDPRAYYDIVNCPDDYE